MRLYLVRHGQTAWNDKQIVQGHSDIELDEIGHDQALAVALHFRGHESLPATSAGASKRRAGSPRSSVSKSKPGPTSASGASAPTKASRTN